jgi:hypothetical protein
MPVILLLELAILREEVSKREEASARLLGTKFVMSKKTILGHTKVETKKAC